MKPELSKILIEAPKGKVYRLKPEDLPAVKKGIKPSPKEMNDTLDIHIKYLSERILELNEKWRAFSEADAKLEEFKRELGYDDKKNDFVNFIKDNLWTTMMFLAQIEKKYVEARGYLMTIQKQASERPNYSYRTYYEAIEANKNIAEADKAVARQMAELMSVPSKVVPTIASIRKQSRKKKVTQEGTFTDTLSSVWTKLKSYFSKAKDFLTSHENTLDANLAVMKKAAMEESKNDSKKHPLYETYTRMFGQTPEGKMSNLEDL